MTSQFDRLQQATSAEREALLGLSFIRAGVDGRLPLGGYVAFLTQAYHHVKHTVPLLMACGARLPAHQEWLRESMAEYIAEELGHQEWILSDIAACGADAEAVRENRPGPAADALVGYAWYVIDRFNPVGFLGMVHVLEGTSVRAASAAADALERALGLAPAAFTYLRSHGSLDVEHVHFFEGLVNRLGDEDLDDVIHCARVFYRLYGDLFRDLDHHPHAEAA